MNKDTALIIRHVNERTFNICLKIVQNKLDADNVYSISAVPFEKTLKEVYELGASLNKKWIITLDADVILLPQTIENLVIAAEQMPDYFFQLEGVIYDKFTMKYRPAGHRIYRRELLKKAIKYIPEAGSQQRPEWHSLKAMAAVGHPSVRTSLVAGLHDFEQYYRDIYRKCFTHSQKHKYWIADLITIWSAKKHIDSDYIIAVEAAINGLITGKKALLNINDYKDDYEKTMKKYGLEEKGKLYNFPEENFLILNDINTTQLDFKAHIADIGFFKPGFWQIKDKYVWEYLKKVRKHNKKMKALKNRLI